MPYFERAPRIPPVEGRRGTPGGIPPWPPGVRFFARLVLVSVTTEQVCSARGCRAPGVWALRWNNPRLHTRERRKVWLACPEHRGSLGEFLTVRGFLRETWPVERLSEDPAPAPGPNDGEEGAR